MREAVYVCTQTTEDADKGLGRIWASERQHVRRMLIGLARDIDLADDLLQETYLRAQSGIPSYRGDNDRAWLSTIARNVFLCHKRRRYVSAEVSDDGTVDAAHYSPVGAEDHLDLIRVREAISELDPNLRTALLMKHYCGFTYREIAEHAQCPVGTAKWRVSLAVGRLNEMLGLAEEIMEMTCADVSRLRVLDYLYGALAPDESEAMARHLRDCPKCRSRVDGTRRILSALDALEGERKHMQVIELDEAGTLTLYTMMRRLNTSDQPIDDLTFVCSKGPIAEYVAAQGEELAFTVAEEHDRANYPNTYLYTAKLPRPVAPGEVCDSMTIFPSLKHRAVGMEPDGSWTFAWKQLTSVENDYAFALALRLPSGAHSVSAEPPATETRVSSSATTLLWRCMRAANQAFECEVTYRLRDNQA